MLKESDRVDELVDKANGSGRALIFNLSLPREPNAVVAVAKTRDSMAPPCAQTRPTLLRPTTRQ